MKVRVNLELKGRIETAKKRLGPNGPRFPVLHDPIEDDKEMAEIIKATKERANAEVDPMQGMGRCHCVWEATRVILKKEHGINWYSPREMNPEVYFD